MTGPAKSIFAAAAAAAGRTSTSQSFHLSGGTVEIPRDRLLEQAESAAGRLQALGVAPGDRVGVLGPNRPEWAIWAFAAWRAGAVLVPVPFPLRVRDPEAFSNGLHRIVERLSIRAVATDPDLGAALPEEVAVPWELPLTGPAPQAVETSPEDVAVIQLSSGTTSDPKGVQLTHAAVLAAVEALIEYDHLRPGEDASLSWKPLFHDWGLFAYLVLPAVGGLEGHSIPTERFARDPRIWFSLLSQTRATVTGGPSSAWGAALRSASKRPETWDLSAVRVASVAAETIDPLVIEGLWRSGGSVGLQRGAVLGGYGLAEATLGASQDRPGEGCSIDEVDLDGLVSAGQARPSSEGRTRRLVSCGRPLPGMEIRIHGADGDRAVGEILLRGPSLTIGYTGDAPGPIDADGWLRTGDLGYRVGETLYVTGRTKDVVIVGGRNYAPDDLEWAAGRVEGVRTGRCVAFSLEEDEGFVVAVETRGDAPPSVSRLVKESVGDAIGITPTEVIVLPKDTIPKTTSGKLRRGAVRTAYLEGALEVLSG